MPDETTPERTATPAPHEPYEDALDEVTALLARMGRLLGKKVTVEIDGAQLDYPDGTEVTGRLTSVELARDGERGGILVWLSGMRDRLLIRRVVHEDATRAGLDNTAGPKWLD